MKIKTTLLRLVGLIASQICHAQDIRPGQRGAAIVSLDVWSDRRVTFRIMAPEADTVILSGDNTENAGIESVYYESPESAHEWLT